MTKILILPTVYLYGWFYLLNLIVQEHKEAKAEGRKAAYVFWQIIGVPFGLAFILADILYDMTIGALWFRQFPEWGRRDKTFTARLKMYKRDHEIMIENPAVYDEDVVTRYNLAVKFCRLLNHVDPDHC